MGCQVTKRKIVKIYGSDDVKIYENKFSADTRAILSACQHMKKHINIWSEDDKQSFELKVMEKMNQELGKYEFLTGDQVSVIDIVVFFEI